MSFSLSSDGSNQIAMNENLLKINVTKSLVDECKYRTYTYKHPRSGKTYKICKDRDGYLVTKPDGGTDAWGTGYSWGEVKSGYGLKGVTGSREVHCYSCN